MTITPEVSAKTLTQLVAMEIKVAMTRADLRQSQLARKLGKNEQWLSVRLRGQQPIDLNDLHLIARGLGMHVHQLLPPPEITERAAEPIAIAQYLEEPARTTSVPQHRPHSRPPTQIGHTRPHTVTRTARLPRPKAA